MADNLVIKYEGTNEDMFWKTAVDSLGHAVDVIVPETHYAVVMKDGYYLETLSSGRKTVVEKGRRKDHALVEIIFMSKTYKLKVLWGTKNQFIMTDGRTGEDFKLGANGEFEVQITSPKHFYLEVVGSESVFNAGNLKARLQARILNTIENEIRKIVAAKSWPAKDVSKHKQEISEILFPKLEKMLELDYGLKLYTFMIMRIITGELDDKQQADTKIDESVRMFCRLCGVALEADDNFCFNCGANVVVPGERGAREFLDPNARFCRHCGHAVNIVRGRDNVFQKEEN